MSNFITTALTTIGAVQVLPSVAATAISIAGAIGLANLAKIGVGYALANSAGTLNSGTPVRSYQTSRRPTAPLGTPVATRPATTAVTTAARRSPSAATRSSAISNKIQTVFAAIVMLGLFAATIACAVPLMKAAAAGVAAISLTSAIVSTSVVGAVALSSVAAAHKHINREGNKGSDIKKFIAATALGPVLYPARALSWIARNLVDLISTGKMPKSPKAFKRFVTEL